MIKHENVLDMSNMQSYMIFR